MTKVLIIALLVVALTGGGFVWAAQSKLAASEVERKQLEVSNAALEASLKTVNTRLALARDAAIVAQKERARMAIQAVKYETVRDAFRKGNFNAPLPDDFKLLVSCLLWRAAGSIPNRTDCP